MFKFQGFNRVYATDTALASGTITTADQAMETADSEICAEYRAKYHETFKRETTLTDALIWTAVTVLAPQAAIELKNPALDSDEPAHYMWVVDRMHRMEEEIETGKLSVPSSEPAKTVDPGLAALAAKLDQPFEDTIKRVSAAAKLVARGPLLVYDEYRRIYSDNIEAVLAEMPRPGSVQPDNYRGNQKFDKTPRAKKVRGRKGYDVFYDRLADASEYGQHLAQRLSGFTASTKKGEWLGLDSQQRDTKKASIDEDIRMNRKLVSQGMGCWFVFNDMTQIAKDVQCYVVMEYDPDDNNPDRTKRREIPIDSKSPIVLQNVGGHSGSKGWERVSVTTFLSLHVDKAMERAANDPHSPGRRVTVADLMETAGEPTEDAETPEGTSGIADNTECMEQANRLSNFLLDNKTVLDTAFTAQNMSDATEWLMFSLNGLYEILDNLMSHHEKRIEVVKFKLRIADKKSAEEIAADKAKAETQAPQTTMDMLKSSVAKVEAEKAAATPAKKPPAPSVTGRITKPKSKAK